MSRNRPRFTSKIIAALTLLALVESLSATIAHASEWQYAGYAKANGVESHQFFDAESISRPTKDVVRVWVKAIRVRNLDRYNKTHEKSVSEKVAQKIAFGYSPQFLMLPAIRAQFADAGKLENANIDLTIYEVIANESGIKTFHQFYFEIDCLGKRIRMLDGVSYNDRGEPSGKSAKHAGDFSFISPDSNAERWSLMMCPVK